jgi:hypothetical protein
MGFVQPAAGPPAPDLVIRGGGNTFWFAASAPLLRLATDRDGITVALAGRLGRIFGSLMPVGEARDRSGVVWRTSWGDLDRAIAARRSIVMWRRDGVYCRFVTLRRRRLAPLLDLVAAHSTKVDRMRGTVLLGTFRKPNVP